MDALDFMIGNSRKVKLFKGPTNFFGSTTEKIDETSFHQISKVFVKKKKKKKKKNQKLA